MDNYHHSGVVLSGEAGLSLVVSNAGVATIAAGATHATNTAVNASDDINNLRYNIGTSGNGTMRQIF